MVLVKMTKKFNKYNEGEVVGLSDHIAEQWCGEVNRNWQVAVRLPEEECQKYMEKPPKNTMVGVGDTVKGEENRGPGRPKTKA